MTDKDYKEKGNQYFVTREYEKAAQCYTNAIIRNPSNPVYFSNRALVGLKLANIEQNLNHQKTPSVFNIFDWFLFL